MRIVSLIASATEMVCALGAEKELVGRSHECDYPASVRKLPQLTHALVDGSASSAEIDRQVKASLAGGGEGPEEKALSICSVDREKLREARPDVILTQTQCEVCAVSLRDVERALWGAGGASAADVGAGAGADEDRGVGNDGFAPKIVSLTPNSLADIWADLRAVAAAIGREKEGDRLIATLQGRMGAVRRMTERLGRAGAASARPRVAMIEWTDPLMAAGNWTPELVAMAGGENLFGEAGKHSPWMSMDELVAKDPDVIVIAPCGFDLVRTREESCALLADARFRAQRAARTGRVYLADGNQYFNRPGPRVAEALEILAEIFWDGSAGGSGSTAGAGSGISKAGDSIAAGGVMRGIGASSGAPTGARKLVFERRERGWERADLGILQ